MSAPNLQAGERVMVCEPLDRKHYGRVGAVVETQDEYGMVGVRFVTADAYGVIEFKRHWTALKRVTQVTPQ